ncbi:MAG: four helix bundle protein [Melioribacteraceae bacterium]
MNEPKPNIVRDKSFAFAVRIVNLYKHLKNDKSEYVLSKQLLRSGTSVGANIREGVNAQSKKDFIHKLSIAQKECDESIYWLELLKETDYITKEEYNSLANDATELLKIIRSIIITTKKNYKL